MRKAIVARSTRKVLNVVVWNEDSSWSPPVGCILVDAADSAIGDIWNGTKFTTPITPVLEEKPSIEERVRAIEIKLGL